MNTDLDKIRGTLYGEAVGDALGIWAEFKPGRTIQAAYPDGGPFEFRGVDRGASKWSAGEWSDDTEQALCILDAYLKDGNLKPTTIAKHLLKWAEENGKGMGNHTWNVLSSSMFSLDPLAISHEIWDSGGRRSAPNGGVMRTATVGILRPGDLDWTEAAAAMACQVTHADPRCVASAVAVSIAIAKLITGDTIEGAVMEALRRATVYEAGCAEFINPRSLEWLQLDEGMGKRRAPIGYTYKCLGAGFWALKQAHELFKETMPNRYQLFKEVLAGVIRAGGDADTNGAVAGAMLGAALGYRSIPKNLADGLVLRDDLDTRLKTLALLNGS